MMPWIFLLMFVGFLPSLIVAGIAGYFSVLNNFAITVAKGIEKEVSKNKEIISDIQALPEELCIEDMPKGLQIKILKAATQGAINEYTKKGGVDKRPLYIIGALALLITIFIFNA